MTEYLDELVGAELAQVWFVRDHLQLIFEDDRESLSLQCYAWPRVQTGSTQIHVGGVGYRDALCEAIGQRVSGVNSSRGITITLTDRTFVLMPNADDLVGPEIAMLHSHGSGSGWTVWRPGEDSFEYLA